MNRFSVLLALWAANGQTVSPEALMAFAGNPPQADFDAAMTALVNEGKVTFKQVQAAAAGTTTAVTTTTLYSLAASTSDAVIAAELSMLPPDEQAAAVALMQLAGMVPGGETFLADSKIDGAVAADAHRGSAFTRLAHAVLARRGQPGFAAGAARTGRLDDRLAAALT